MENEQIKIIVKQVLLKQQQKPDSLTRKYKKSRKFSVGEKTCEIPKKSLQTKHMLQAIQSEMKSFSISKW